MTTIENISKNLQQTSDHIKRNGALLELGEYDPKSIEDATKLLEEMTELVWSSHKYFPQRIFGDVFHVGVSFRHIIRRHKDWVGNKYFFDKVLDLAKEKKYEDGRSGFIYLLQYGGMNYAKHLIKFLDDPTLAQATIHVLRILGDLKAANKIRPYLTDKEVLIRDEAKKYFKKIEK